MTSTKPAPSLSVPSTRPRQRVRSRDWPRPPRRDPHTRVIAQIAELAGTDVSVIASSSRPWASATFVGAQHRVILRFEGEAAQHRATCFADALPEAEFSLSGHIVADACVNEWVAANPADQAAASQCSGITLRITVLTVEDW